MLAFRGMPTVPIVRVPWNDQVHVKQALDLGADGVLAPMVRSAAEARALVAAAKYPPDGIRGFGPRRASDYGRDIDAYVASANAETIVIPQIEDVGAAEAIEEILAVPGVDALCIGPNDLSGSAGVLRQHDHPAVRGAIDKILSAASARGVAVCTGITLPLEQQQRLDRARRPAGAADLGRRAPGRRRCRHPGRGARKARADERRRRHRTIGSAPPTRCCARSLDAEAEDAPEPAAGPGWLGRLLSNRDVAILLVALVLFVLFALAGPRFLSENNLIDIARRAAILGILAVGMTYLFIAGELDLSIGSHYGFLLILMSFQEERLGIDPWLASGVVIVIGLAIGAVNGLLVTRIGLPSFITTLGMLALLARRRQHRLERLPDPGQEHRPGLLPDHPRRLPGHADPQPVRRDGGGDADRRHRAGAHQVRQRRLRDRRRRRGGAQQRHRHEAGQAHLLRADGRACAASARRCCSAGSASRRSAPGSISSCR